MINIRFMDLFKNKNKIDKITGTIPKICKYIRYISKKIIMKIF